MATGLEKALAGAVRWIEDQLLVDTVRIRRPSLADPVFNDTTGQLAYPEAAVVYQGPGAIQGGTAQSELTTTPTAGQQWVQDTRSRYRLLTPLDAPLAAKDDLIDVVTVASPVREVMIGRVWLAQDPGRVATVEAVRITPLDQKPTTPETP